jgi:hypothetical protein
MPSSVTRDTHERALAWLQARRLPHVRVFLAMHERSCCPLRPSFGSPRDAVTSAQPLTQPPAWHKHGGAAAWWPRPPQDCLNGRPPGAKQVASTAATTRVCGSCPARFLAGTRPIPLSPSPSWLSVDGQAGHLGVSVPERPRGRTSADRGAPRSMGCALPARPSQRPCTGGGASGSSAPASAGVSTRPEPSACRRRLACQDAAETAQAAVELITDRFENPRAASHAVTLAYHGRPQPDGICAATERAPQALRRGAAAPIGARRPPEVRCSFLCHGKGTPCEGHASSMTSVKSTLVHCKTSIRDFG